MEKSTNGKLVVWVGGFGILEVALSSNPFHKGIPSKHQPKPPIYH